MLKTKDPTTTLVVFPFTKTEGGHIVLNLLIIRVNALAKVVSLYVSFLHQCPSEIKKDTSFSYFLLSYK